MRAYVPAPRLFDKGPGLIAKTLSTTYISWLASDYEGGDKTSKRGDICDIIPLQKEVMSWESATHQAER